jgi:hypothetical protein
VLDASVKESRYDTRGKQSANRHINVKLCLGVEYHTYAYFCNTQYYNVLPYGIYLLPFGTMQMTNTEKKTAMCYLIIFLT